MLKVLMLIVVAVGLCWSEVQMPCDSLDDCASFKCHAGVKRCFLNQCRCTIYPGKRFAFQNKLEGECVSNEECHERCQPTGLFFGRCMMDYCFCYTLP